MNAREYLKTLDAYCINIPTSTDRKERFEKEFKDVFKSITYIAPPIFENPEEVGMDFKLKLIQTAKEFDSKKLLTNKVFTDYDLHNFYKKQEHKNTKNDASPHTALAYAKTFSRSLANMYILDAFLESDEKHCIILEDDAQIRPEVLDSIDSIDNYTTADFIAWGGCHSGIDKDTEYWLQHTKPNFRKIKPHYRNWCATAIEYSRAAAIKYLDLYEIMPAIVCDASWKYLFADPTLNCYAVQPMAIVQNSISTITNGEVQMPVTLEQAKKLRK